MTSILKRYIQVNSTSVEAKTSSQDGLSCYYDANAHGLPDADKYDGMNVLIISLKSFAASAYQDTGQASVNYPASRPVGANAAFYNGIGLVYAYPRMTIEIESSGDVSLPQDIGTRDQQLSLDLASRVIPVVTGCLIETSC